MTWKELKNKVEAEGAKDDSPVAVYLADGSLDYAVLAYIQDEGENQGTVVISGN